MRSLDAVMLQPGSLAGYLHTSSTMKPMTLVALLLVVFGVIALAYQGITYTKREKVVDIGPIHATTEKVKTIPIPPMIGAAAVVGGVVLLVASGRRRAL